MYRQIYNYFIYIDMTSTLDSEKFHLSIKGHIVSLIIISLEGSASAL
jgi:hypothetical protein